MRHPAEDQLGGALKEAAKRARLDSFHGAVTQVRHYVHNAELQQLYSANGRQLRILAAGNGATDDDIGKFWFVVGYSIPAEDGGTDIVPEV